MSRSPEVIKREIEESRQALSAKVEELKRRISTTTEKVTHFAETTKETVQDAVSKATEKLASLVNLQRHAEDHPWLVVGGSVLTGFLGEKMLGGESHNGKHQPSHSHSEHNGKSGSKDEPSLLSRLGHAIGAEMEQVKGLAIGGSLGAIRDIITDSLPSRLGSRIGDIMNDLTTRLGGEPIEGPVMEDEESSSEQSGEGKQRKEKSMQSATSQKWEGRWDQFKGKIKSVWGDITDDHLLEAEGDYERTVGLIKERTGESREEIERKLNQ